MKKFEHLHFEWYDSPTLSLAVIKKASKRLCLGSIYGGTMEFCPFIFTWTCREESSAHVWSADSHIPWYLHICYLCDLMTVVRNSYTTFILTLFFLKKTLIISYVLFYAPTDIYTPQRSFPNVDFKTKFKHSNIRRRDKTYSLHPYKLFVFGLS
jgi:hypothetical protein